MRAAVLHAAGGPLTVEDVPRPNPAPGEALVRVRACGLGLTLVWNRNGRRDARLPRIIGHEIAGEVVEVGPGVNAFRPGDRVAVYYYLTCGVCRWCRAGRDDLCTNRRGQVGREIDGGLAEFVALPATNLVPLPAGIDDVGAAITSDAVATALHVLTARARLEAGETVLVVGAGGGVGVHVVQIARFLGGRVIALDLGEEKLALAREAGAEVALEAGGPSVGSEIQRQTEGRGVDVVVELVGRSETLELSVGSLGVGGRLVLVGSYERDAEIALTHATLRDERSVLGSQYCTRAELEQALALVAEGRIQPIVTRLCRLEEADAVLRDIEAMAVAGRACIVFD
jgi:propanol-preferring alcohol dehydrogenase